MILSNILILDFEVRTQCFFCKISKNLSREHLVVPKFSLEVPKFKENVLICVITVIKLRDLLLTHSISDIEVISNRRDLQQDIFWTEYYVQKRNKKHAQGHVLHN